MKIVVQLTPTEYAEYIKNADADTTRDVDAFILDCISDHAAVLIYDAEIRVIADAIYSDPTREKRA